MLNQFWQIVDPFAKRWYGDFKGIDPKQQILTKLAGNYHLLQ